MSKYYKEAIHHITSEYNWHEVCIEIAQNNPKLFCDAINKLTGETDFVEQVKSILETDKIAAIKFVRQEKNMTLIDAKNYVEQM
jgi:ribosomal protein L7/L12